MDTVKIISEKQNQTNLTSPDMNETKITGRVDINHLIARVRKEKDKADKINLIILCSFAALVLLIGIILSF